MSTARSIGLALTAGALLIPAVAVGAPGAATAKYRLGATMTAAKMAAPHPKGNVASARGSLTGTLTVAKKSTANWTLTYSGTTGKVTAARLRYTRADGLTEQVLLCATTCRSGLKVQTTFRSRLLAQRLVQQALAKKADVVLSTKRNPRGEVRGLLTARQI